MFQGINTSASALTSQRLRMDVVSSNMANAESTRGRLVDGEWEPYRRKMVVMEPNQTFKGHLNRAQEEQRGNGVKVSRIVEDQTPFKLFYQPTHPDADDNGFVQLPNVDPLKEMVDMMSASRSYEANITALDAHKNMLLKALEIGK
ncbi:flagellar basal body rod protein FlgC [Alteribacter aurantiacus]|uniref:flagellar basal body rod protein FlgC n=1 Tax=Alteribacter aurantiacus TaxID=254410 RepID=UPI00047ABD7D|nr:flagellar basal body rod protein FlgC [Alteribacter aurantiacus]